MGEGRVFKFSMQVGHGNIGFGTTNQTWSGSLDPVLNFEALIVFLE